MAMSGKTGKFDGELLRRFHLHHRWQAALQTNAGISAFDGAAIDVCAITGLRFRATRRPLDAIAADVMYLDLLRERLLTVARGQPSHAHAVAAVTNFVNAALGAAANN
jgi:hypothetical protein